VFFSSNFEPYLLHLRSLLIRMIGI
jgi:hypothetical protein